MPSYRHVPLSQRLGLSSVGSSYWQLEMPNAECFMYFVANLNRLFGQGFTLYVEGRPLDPEVVELYQACAAPNPEKVTALDRNPATQRLHVAMGPALSKRMNHLAACKTYAQMGEAMLVYQDGKVWMDGRRLGERAIKLSGDLREAEVRKFGSGLLRAQITAELAHKKAEKERFKILKDLVHFVVGEERGLTQEFSRGSQDYAKLEEKNASKKAEISEQEQMKRAAGMTRFAKRFNDAAANAGKMGQEIATGIATAFESFVVSLKKGEQTLTNALASMGKAILKSILSAIGDELISKAVVYLLIALSLLAGIFTAGLSVTFFISSAYLMAIGLGLKILSAAFLEKGGLVVRPTLAVVGEGDQPEIVIPADRFAEFGLGGGLHLDRLKVVFPDLVDYREASQPVFHDTVARELQSAYQASNQRMN